MRSYRFGSVPSPGLVRGIVAILVLLVGLPATAMDAAIEAYDPPETCVLCDGSLHVPVVKLTSSWLDSLVSARARVNEAQIARIDSLFDAGYYGSPKVHEARRAANLVARLTLINAYPDLIRLAGDTTRVYEADEATLQDVTARYSDVFLFATVRLQRLRFGLGRACLHYDVSTVGKGESVQGGEPLAWRIKEAQVGGRMRRLLSLDLPTATDDVVEVLLAPHHTFKVEYARFAGPPAPYELFLVHEIEGGWLRKAGTHRPTAYMYWVTPAGPEPAGSMALIAGARGRRPEDQSGVETLTPAVANRTPLETNGGTNEKLQRLPVDVPEIPLMGVRIYIPGLKLRLPSFLPDINFDDLREIEPPMPILDMEYLKRDGRPSWLGSAEHDAFKDWKGVGPLPPALRLRFPDL